MKNPVGQVENVVEVQDTGNTKDKALENLIGDKYAFIDIAIISKNSFIDKATKVFIKQSEYQYYFLIVILSVDQCQQVYDCNDKNFLGGMYLIADTKLYNINIYKHHIEFFALNLYLVDVSIIFLCIWIQLLWEHCYNITLFTFFINIQCQPHFHHFCWFHPHHHCRPYPHRPSRPHLTQPLF